MTHTPPAGRALGLAAALLAAACTTGGGGGRDGSAAPGDGGPADARSDGTTRVATFAALTPFPVDTWMVSLMPAGRDPVLPRVERGTFTYPKAGWTGSGADRHHWSARKPGKDGSLGAAFPRGLVYAVARVRLARPRTLIARADTALSLRVVGGAVRPGDVYRSRRIRVALPLKAGENIIVARISGGRGATILQLSSTPDPVYLNARDLTAGDLVVGQKAGQCLGLPLLNLAGKPLLDLRAEVVGGADFAQAALTLPGLAPGAVTQLAFPLRPRRAFATAGRDVTVTLRVSSPSLPAAYQQTVTLKTIAAGGVFRRSRVSRVDGSCQYYGVRPPSPLVQGKRYALALSLHGAGVEAIGQARSYSAKDWAYVVAPTNRRPFGFDWEVWGRLDGIEALDDAMAAFAIDPARVYVTGHSMGGHGTWHFGVMHTGRFRVVGPSAGWGSFYSYTGARRPSGAFARSQAHSDTHVYLSNLARRSVYVLHGGADTNVPTREGRAMYAAAKKFVTDITLHVEPGKGHWWNGTRSKGVDCVDWPPLFDKMKATRLTLPELDFDWRTPAPWVNARRSFVTVRSQKDPYADTTVRSRRSGSAVTVTTTNARGLLLDGATLKKAGVTRLTVDGKSVPLKDGPIAVGPQDGKRPDVHGPFNQVFYRPYCLVYDDKGPAAFRDYAAFLTSAWSVIGNGRACALPLSRLTPAIRAAWNVLYLGVPSARIPSGKPAFTWTDQAIVAGGGTRYRDAALAVAFPAGQRLHAAMTATRGAEYLLFRIQPFTSRLVIPDYFVWDARGRRTAGFFTASWAYDAKLAR